MALLLTLSTLVDLATPSRDCILTAALGAWIGWQAMPLSLLVASVLSVVFFLLSRLSRLSISLKWNQGFAFGPFLIVGFVVVGMVAL
jgi:prepilin signal peptidase PulO-like enzyme (type II secretory pathway)